VKIDENTGNNIIIPRGRSRGSVQGVKTPPPPGMN